jgi:hypothetical protein
VQLAPVWLWHWRLTSRATGRLAAAGVTFLRHSRQMIDLMDAWKVEMSAGRQKMNQDALNKVIFVNVHKPDGVNANDAAIVNNRNHQIM